MCLCLYLKDHISSQSDMISNTTNLSEVSHEANFKISGIFWEQEGLKMIGLETVLIHDYLTLVISSHVGKESAVDFNF